ncbi:hypothetical protein ACR6C2_40465 [Streptomyces sp. INA 01156]
MRRAGRGQFGCCGALPRRTSTSCALVKRSTRSLSVARPSPLIADGTARAAKAGRSGSRPVSSQSTVVSPNSAMRARSREVNRRTPLSDLDSLSGVSPTLSANSACLTDALSMTLRTRSVTVSFMPSP